MVRRARVQERAGQYTTAMRTITRAREVLAEAQGLEAERVRVRLDNLTAITRLGQQKTREARDWAIRAAQGARQVDDPETLVQALMAIEFAELYMGLPITGVHTREALDISVARGYRPRESIARANLGNFAYFAGRWDEAVEWYASSRQAALEGGQRLRSRGDRRQPRGHPGEPGTGGRGRGGPAGCREGPEGVGDGLRGAVRRTPLARVLLVRGELEAAEAAIVAGNAELVARGHRMTALEASLVHAEVATRAGRPQEALAIIDEAERAAGDEAVSLRARACVQRASALLALRPARGEPGDG